MYNYIYYHESLPCSMIIVADNKKIAERIIKRFNSWPEWKFQERKRN